MSLPKRLYLSSMAACCLLGFVLAQQGVAGVGVIQGSAVGGVSIDVDGVVSHPEIDNELQRVWEAALDDVPAELDRPTDLRFVSLRQLEAEIVRHREQFLPLPESVQCLAGLQRVQYVLVYPERGDIVLAGPADGWKMDRWGNVVGKSSERPVLMLDDLMAALRARRSSADGGMSCSIDPTPEGLARYRRLRGSLRTIGNPQHTMALIEETLGEQVVTVTGVPETSRFARVMVAADFRMKRLGMNFEPASIADLPSYLHLMSAGRTGPQNALPRWWLAPHYEPLHKSPDGLAWELRGPGVKCMTEQDYIAADGTRAHSGKAGSAAQRWADMLTVKFEELAGKDSAFGNLRNVMDLAVVAALIESEQLLQKTGLNMPMLLEAELLQQYNAPKTVASQASFVQKGRNYIISASGGVQFNPWEILQAQEETQEVASIRSETEPPSSWWWD